MSLTLPDGRIVYNLPEQVAKNAADIKKIAAILDGLNIQDNLVAIADISQNLTSAELDIVEKPVAFLYYSDQLYIKRNEVGGSAYFDVIFSITGSTVISFTSKQIEVVLSTGGLVLTTSTYSTYSKTELDTQLGLKAATTYVDAQLALKANLSGADFTGNITAPKISQSTPNNSLNVYVYSGTGWNLTTRYQKFEVINGVLYFISNLIIENATASPATASSSLCSGTVSSIPAEISDNVYDINNDKVSDAIGSNALITITPAFFTKNINSNSPQQGYLRMVNATTANAVAIYFDAPGISVNPGEKLYITARVALTLI